MSNKENETRKQEIKTKFYKKAVFPWMILVILVTLVTGVITGWVLRSNDFSRVQAEASQLANSLKDQK